MSARADTRRRFLVQATQIAFGGALVARIGATPARADARAMAAAIAEVTKGAPVKPGRITIDMPSLVENGNVVPLVIKVDSPMTAADHVAMIHVFNEKNPQPHVITLTLGPRAGIAETSTRIKLADTQQVTAIAQMNDGSFWSTSADVIVTIAACIEDAQ